MPVNFVDGVDIRDAPLVNIAADQPLKNRSYRTGPDRIYEPFYSDTTVAEHQAFAASAYWA